MKNKHYPLYLALFFATLFSSCAQKKKQQKVNLQISSAFAGVDANYAAGGAMLYGKNNFGHAFAYRVDNIPNQEILLDNGQWSFFLLTWDGLGDSSKKMQGESTCAHATALVDGEDLETPVPLNLSTSACRQLSFAGDYENNTFSKIQLNSCDTLSGVTNAASTACNDVNAGKGPIVAYKIIAAPFRWQSDLREVYRNPSALAVANPLVSDCSLVNIGNRDSDAQPMVNLPMRNHLASPLFTIVRAYFSSTTCDDSDPSGYKDYDFAQGISNVAARPAKFYLKTIATPGSIANKFSLFLATSNGEVCQGPRASLSAQFSAGTGDAGLPYAICNTHQFNNIGGVNFSVNKTKHFTLLNNLDFSPPAGSTTSNFVMIGEPVVATGNFVTMPFSGTFYGNGHTLANIFQMEFQDTHQLGVFRYIDQATISDLTLKNIVFECADSDPADGITDPCSEIGLLVGAAKGSGTTLINNIRTHGHAQGFEKIGGIAGLMEGDVRMTDVHANFYADGAAKIGGLVGAGNLLSATAIIDKSSFMGQIYARPETPLATDGSNGMVGGLIGIIMAGSNANAKISESVAKGTISALEQVGGLVGVMSAGQIIDSYSQAHIQASNHKSAGGFYPPYAGGLVGKLLSGAKIDNSFAHFSVQSSSATGIGNDETLAGLASGDCALVNNSYFTGVDNRSGTVTNGEGCGLPYSQHALQDSSDSKYSAYSLEIDALATSSSIWIAFHDGDEAPRLRWELDRQDSVPYLQRHCSASMYATFDGNNICTQAQFQSLSPGNYFLNKNLDFKGLALAPRPAGVYILNGNNHSLLNIHLLVDGAPDAIGIFKDLYPGSLLKDLNINNMAIKNSTSFNLQTSKTIGTVAGINSGVIENVSLKNSAIKLENLSIAPTVPTSIEIGGLVGRNEGNGLIISSKIGAEISLMAMDFSTPLALLRVGGITGINSPSGYIQGTENHSNIHFNSTPAAGIASAAPVFAGDTGHATEYGVVHTDFIRDFCDASKTNKYFIAQSSGSMDLYGDSTPESWQIDDVALCDGSSWIQSNQAGLGSEELLGFFNPQTLNASAYETLPATVVSDGDCNAANAGNFYHATSANGSISLSVDNPAVAVGDTLFCRDIFGDGTTSGFTWVTMPFPLPFSMPPPAGTFQADTGYFNGGGVALTVGDCAGFADHGKYYINTVATGSGINLGNAISPWVAEEVIFCNGLSAVWEKLSFNISNTSPLTFNGEFAAATESIQKVLHTFQLTSAKCHAGTVDTTYRADMSGSFSIDGISSWAVDDTITCADLGGGVYSWVKNPLFRDQIYFGGIAGINQGIIEVVKNNTFLDIENPYARDGLIGGVAGLNTLAGIISNVSTDANFETLNFVGTLGGVTGAMDSNAISAYNFYGEGLKSSDVSVLDDAGGALPLAAKNAIIGDNTSTNTPVANYAFVSSLSDILVDTVNEFTFTGDLSFNLTVTNGVLTGVTTTVDQGSTIPAFAGWSLGLHSISLNATPPSIFAAPIWSLKASPAGAKEAPELNFFSGGLHQLKPGFPD